MKNNVSNDIFSKLKESTVREEDKERLSDLAYRFCDEVGNEDDLEYVIKEMTWWLEERRKQLKDLKKKEPGLWESSDEGSSLNASGLYDMWINMENDIPDFADKWNNCTGYPEEVKRQRIRLVNPTVVEFVSEYADDLKANWDEFYDLMTDGNYHTPLFAIEKELAKYE